MNEDIRRYRDDLRDELNGAALYTALGEVERDPVRKDLFLQLSQAEAMHAEFCARSGPGYPYCASKERLPGYEPGGRGFKSCRSRAFSCITLLW
jgi:hypothetical protein